MYTYQCLSIMSKMGIFSNLLRHRFGFPHLFLQFWSQIHRIELFRHGLVRMDHFSCPKVKEPPDLGWLFFCWAILFVEKNNTCFSWVFLDICIIISWQVVDRSILYLMIADYEVFEIWILFVSWCFWCWFKNENMMHFGPRPPAQDFRGKSLL